MTRSRGDRVDEPKSLDKLFKEKLFRIPDYQRGYAWQPKQLAAFWEDLVNLPDSRSHYMDVLTLKAIPNEEVISQSKEFWLVDDHSYHIYHIVDGQQRLTTFIILLQAFVEVARQIPENQDRDDCDIYVTDSLTIEDIIERYLYKLKPRELFRTYKFGYEKDNPSDEYLRYRILQEDGGGTVAETFYTLNLGNAKTYFYGQIKKLHEEFGMQGLTEMYRKLTKQFLFNEYTIKDEFDVFVAFETMNNRGKKLSDLELLKNRLIYLTTLYEDEELDESERNNLRETINDAWREVYYQLGRNKTKPLNDDDFLRAHWTMYFKYSRKTGRDYIRFLLEDQFTAQKIHKKIVHEVKLEDAEEVRDHDDADDDEDDDVEDSELENAQVATAQLKPQEIRKFVLSLKDSSVHWFNSFYPELSPSISDEERAWIERLNRINITYFRPVVMAILKNEPNEKRRIQVFKKIERFIFVVFRMTKTRSNYRSSEFYNAARDIDAGKMSLEGLEARLDKRMSWLFDEHGKLKNDEFYLLLEKKFDAGSGYYGWSGLRYFLFEYELSLLDQSRQQKVGWNDLLKSKKDRISIEHIYPQTESEYWKQHFDICNEEQKAAYKASLGNLLLLSASINSSLQNDGFPSKKNVKKDADGNTIRNGYADGSHSEIEVSGCEEWGTGEIWDRGLKLLKFMEDRWEFSFQNDEMREELMFLNFEPPEPDSPYD